MRTFKLRASIPIGVQVPAGRPRRARSLAAARVAVLFGPVAFVAIQVAFNLAVRSGWLPLNDPVYVEKFEILERQRAFFADRSGDTSPRVILLGSSRSHLGFDAQRFAARTRTLAFNFGIPGAGPLTHDIYLRRLSAAGVRAECVLLELHPGLFMGTIEGNFLTPCRLRAGEPALLDRLGHDTGPNADVPWRRWLMSTHVYRYSALNRYAVRWLPCSHGLTLGFANDPFGFVPGLDLPAAERPKALQRTLVQYAHSLLQTGLNAAAVNATRETVAWCRDHDVRVIAFVSAEASPLRAAYRPEANAAFETFLDTLGVPVVRARACVPDELFSDGHHMTRPGSAIFTDELATAYEANRR